MKQLYHSMIRRLLFPFLLGCVGIFALTAATSWAQEGMEELPAAELDPNKVVSLERSLPFPQAIQILNGFAQQYEKRFIVDKTNTEGAINVSLPPMHWKKALNYIVDAKGLQAQYTKEAIEIVKPQPEAQQPGQGPQQPGGPAAGGGGSEVQLPGLNTREVRIEATFFEGNQQALKQVGVDWSTLTSDAPVQTGQGGGQQQGPQFPVETGDDFVRVDARGAQSVSQNLFSSLVNFGEVGAAISVQALFSAFEQDNMGQILAHPTIKVLEGNKGRIQVGQDFSVKQKTFSGNVTEQFFSVGTILEVTPYIIEKGDSTFIYLTLMAERSSAQPTSASSIINKQTATTNITLLDGESTVIAGLYRTEKSTSRQGVPILKDLPPWFLGLRYLFGYNSTNQLVRELVILIEASIEPSLPDRIAQDSRSTIPEQLKKEREYYETLTRPNKTTVNKEKPLIETIHEDTELEYYIIGGSYKNETKANEHKKRLRKEGYMADIIRKPKSDLLLVSLFQAQTSKKAEFLLEEVRTDVNKDAWIYKRKKASTAKK